VSDREREPEAIAEISRSACIGCEQCVPVCPTEAIAMDPEGIAVVDAERCTGCRECVKACPTAAIVMSGDGPAAAEFPEKKGAKPATDVETSPEVWVFVEHTDGRVAPVSWELLGKGAELVRDLGGRLSAVILGREVEPLVREAAAYGAEKAYVIEDSALTKYSTAPYLRGLVRLVEEYRPEVLLLGATTTGRDLAGAVATSLRTGLTADCTALTIDPNTKLLEQTRPAYGGNIMATILCETRRPQMATVRPRVMAMPPRQEGRECEVIRASLAPAADDMAVRMVEYLPESDAERVRIEDATILVSGGRGLGGPEGFRMLADLAQVLGGTVSGSRAAVDQGWIDQAHQVGQTGKTVRPRLYLACGISGAIQHLVGMETSDIIVAINRDPHAPIFGVATYGLVGDVNELVPALTRALKTRLPGRGGVNE